MSTVSPGVKWMTLLVGTCMLAPSSVAIAAQSPVFSIDEEEADRVVYEAMTAEFPGKTLVPVTAPYSGYRATTSFALNRYTLTAHRIPEIAQVADGSLVQGYRFEVSLRGSVPRAARTRAERIMQRMEREASQIAPALRAMDDPTAAAEENNSLGIIANAALQPVPGWLLVVVFALGTGFGMASIRLARVKLPARGGESHARLASADARPPESGSDPLGLEAVSRQAEGSWWSSEFLELTHDAVIIWEMDGAGILYWNRSAEQLYGYSREEAQGEVSHRLLHTEASGSVNDLETKLARYGVWVGELQHRRRDGRRITVEGRLALLSQRNGRWLVLEVNRDLTDRTRAAERSSAMERRLSQLRAD